MIYIRRIRGARWHRLTVVGVEHHATACLEAIPVDELVQLSANPPADEVCGACDRDRAVRVARTPTVDLRPRDRSGRHVDVDVETGGIA